MLCVYSTSICMEKCTYRKWKKMHSSSAWYTFFFLLSKNKLSHSEWHHQLMAVNGVIECPLFIESRELIVVLSLGNIMLCVGCFFVALIVKIYVSIGSEALSEWAMKMKMANWKIRASLITAQYTIYFHLAQRNDPTSAILCEFNCLSWNLLTS